MSETSSTTESSENQPETEMNTDLKSVFTLFDISKQNRLHHYEFQVALEALGFKSNHPLVQCQISHYKDLQEQVTYDDFKEIVTTLMESRDKVDEMLSIFEIFDIDGTNKISLKNLKTIVTSLCETVHDNELEGMINAFDIDEDGEISCEEFMSMMTDSEEYESLLT